jgi:nucleoside-diphosphate-sugar epimerase
MKYLITGGAGFIGANLVKKLFSDGHEVVVVDNYAGGKRADRIFKGAKYIDEDVADYKKLNKICRDGFDGIFHLAALPRVSYSMEHPVETHQTNVNGTLNVLTAAKENKIKRVIFSSSAAVYGDQEKFPVDESLKPGPVSPYGLHKLIGEQYCSLFSLIYGVETVNLRYFNVYGPYFDPEGAYALVVGKFIDQRKRNQPLTICGDGEYFRDYVHVADVVSANLSAMTGSSVGRGEIINIGSGSSCSVNELAKIIGGSTVNIAPRAGDPRKTEADISLAKKLLGWEPKVELEQGLKEMMK